MFSKKTLDAWGRQTGFIRRRKIICALDFLALMTVGQLGMKHPSLAGMVEAIKVSISREAMHRRFSPSAVAFMRKCVDFVLKQKASEMTRLRANIIQHFKRILIFDSTGWDISPALRDVLPGSGGGASSANCKIQVCYEYKSGSLDFFDIQPGIVSDNSYTARLPSHLTCGDLLLVDLGYFSLKTFHQIVSMGAFFISRLLIGTKLICPETMKPIDLSALLKKIPLDIHHMNVLMGSEHSKQIKCRLVCLRVTPEVANERRRKLRKRSQKHQSTPSENHLMLADWVLMVTNVPEEWLPAEMLRPFYSLRWQIELLFKQLKSVLCVHHSNTGRADRLRCEIYGKLIMAILLHRIHADINIRLWNTEHRELSMEKLYKRFQERAFIILDLMLVAIEKAIAYLRDEIPRLIKNCMKSRQRSRRSTLEIIQYGQLGSANTTISYAA